ncbi:MAG TPA: PP2C family protein-serine/threonine phosphatase [Kofleriaceae bacterium]|nr:PP2C family protein-serine/threonine phosphatase [Kofleriaceae bacterium]
MSPPQAAPGRVPEASSATAPLAELFSYVSRPAWNLAAITAELQSASTHREMWATTRIALEARFRRAAGVHAVFIDHASNAPRSVWGGGRELFARLATSARIDDQGDAEPRLASPGQTALAPHGQVMWAPMLGDGGVLGLLLVEQPREAAPFDLDEMLALSGLASQVGAVMVQLNRATSRALRYELALAQRLQQKMISAVPRELAGFAVTTTYRPHFEVGGDFFDIVRTGSNQVTAIIGDVSGKGVAAAMLMSQVSSVFRSVARGARSPALLLERLNTDLLRSVPDDTFVTAACVHYDALRGRLVVANAGHCVPLVKRASGGVVLAGRASGAPLAMMEGERYRNVEIAVEPGDIVILVTDGIPDGLDPARSGQGAWKLADVVARAPHAPDDLRGEIMDEVLRGSATDALDDIAIMTLQQVVDSTR